MGFRRLDLRVPGNRKPSSAGEAGEGGHQDAYCYARQGTAAEYWDIHEYWYEYWDIH